MPEGLMQSDFGLTLQRLRRRMTAVHAGAEVVTSRPRASERAGFVATAQRVDRLADAPGGIGPGPARLRLLWLQGEIGPGGGDGGYGER